MPRSSTRCSILARRVFMPQPVANYIARLVKATHPGEPHAAAA